MYQLCCNNTILMFHRVARPVSNGLRFHQHLKVSPEYFETILRKFRSNGYSFVSMDEMIAILVNKKRVNKILSVTFDDGFADNYTNALPILKDLNVPAIVYVATGLLTGDFQSVWERLEAVIVNNDRLNLSNGFEIPIEKQSKKEEAFLALRQLLLLCKDQYRSFSKLFDLYIDESAKTPKKTTAGQIGIEDRMMTLEELKSWAAEPLCSVGCHTHSHINCADLDSIFVQNDILHSLDLLRNHWNIPVRHFAYPYGDSIAIPQKDLSCFWENNGIVSCVTTTPRFIDFQTEENSYFLPRYMVNMFNTKDLVEEFQDRQRAAIRNLIRSILNPLRWIR